MKKVMVERKNFAQKLEPFDCEVSEKQDAHDIIIIKEGLGEDNLLRDAWRQERLEYQCKAGKHLLSYSHYTVTKSKGNRCIPYNILCSLHT